MPCLIHPPHPDNFPRHSDECEEETGARDNFRSSIYLFIFYLFIYLRFFRTRNNMKCKCLYLYVFVIHFIFQWTIDFSVRTFSFVNAKIIKFIKLKAIGDRVTHANFNLLINL